MIMKENDGDLMVMIANTLMGKVKGHLIIAQGCNCHITQGSGVAGQLREYPTVFEADQEFGRYADKSKLGEYSIAAIGDNVTVLNMYTQFGYGTNTRHANYSAIAHCFARANLEFGSYTIVIPKIGSDLAGGDWDIIEQIIDDATPELAVTVLNYVGGIDPRI